MPLGTFTPAVNFTPSATKIPTALNFINYSDMIYANPEMPFHISNIMVERYADETLDHFMEKKGLKMAYNSDAISWKEENRLTQIIKGATRVGDVFTSVGHTFRTGEILTVWNTTGTEILHKGPITATTATTFTASCGTSVGGWTGLNTTGLTCISGMGDFKKGSVGMQESLNTTFETFTARGAIIKDMQSENRTNLTQLVWFKSKDAKTGSDKWAYFDTNIAKCEKRYRNKREAAHFDMQDWEGDAVALGLKGRQGMFDAMEEGNVVPGFISNIASLQNLTKQLDKQGGIRSNHLFGSSQFCYELDTMLASTNIATQSYGEFEQESNRELELSFKGVSLGGYKFNYGNIRYLNDPLGHGERIGVNKVNGFLIPSSSQTSIDPLTGQSAPKPILYTMYRAMNAINRDYEMVVRDWADGTALTDTRTVEFQSEQATVLMSRNNTVLFKG